MDMLDTESVRAFLKAEFGNLFDEMERQALANMLYWMKQPCEDNFGETLGQEDSNKSS